VAGWGIGFRETGKLTLSWLEAHTLSMRRVDLRTFLFVAILGLGCMGVSAPGKADGHCEDKSNPRYDPVDCEEQGKNSNSSSLGELKTGWHAYKIGDYATALREFNHLAERGNTDAQVMLGQMHEKGEGVPQDSETAVKWWRLAGKQGNTDAQQKVAWMYLNGYGVPMDFGAGLIWLRLSAKQGNALAQHNLCRLHLHGAYSVPRDYKAALNWCKLAADQGFPEAQNTMGGMHSRGQGVLQDDKTALKWHRLAAEQGNDYARGRVAELQQKFSGRPLSSYQKGLDAFRKGDYATALREWEPLADQGDATAQYNVGVMYENGEGVPSDRKTAVKWWRLAAAQGHAPAQDRLKTFAE